MPDQPREARPKRGAGWSEVPSQLQPDTNTLASSWWMRNGVSVGSALVIAKYPSGDGIGPQRHLSMSGGARGGGLSRAERRTVLRDFGALGWEEDNHHPGIARHFWQPLDAKERVACECKTDETIVQGPDGYQWTNPTDGSCRGCEYERDIGLPCPLHAK